jgi:hypothetical protein
MHPLRIPVQIFSADSPSEINFFTPDSQNLRTPRAIDFEDVDTWLAEETDEADAREFDDKLADLVFRPIASSATRRI